jgi:hypothetical protein
MRSKFLLFQSPIDLAHRYWEKILRPGDLAVDATCGNGKDTLKLAQLSLNEVSGEIYAYDIQSEAIKSAQKYLSTQLNLDQFLRIRFIQASHTEFSSAIRPLSVRLIVYNLGYLPGGNKNLTTDASTTLASVASAMPLICHGGVVSITCYPGHSEGLVEETALLRFASELDPSEWSCCHHQWLNRRASPSLILLQKSTKPDNGAVT